MHHWATEGLNAYALARLLWDPGLSVDAILDDYCRSGFGPAAVPVKGWFLRIESLTDQVAAQGLSKLAPYTSEECDRLHRLLDLAAGAARDDDLIRQRIEFLRSGISFVEIQARTHAFAESHRDQKPSREETDRFRADMEAKFRLMRRIYRDQPLALNAPMIAWGSEGIFRRFGWSGAKTLSPDRWDAAADGRLLPAPPSSETASRPQPAKPKGK